MSKHRRSRVGDESPGKEQLQTTEEEEEELYLKYLAFKQNQAKIQEPAQNIEHDTSEDQLEETNGEWLLKAVDV